MKQEDRITVYQTEEKPCLTTGHRLYVIGGQNGMFPQKGEHMGGEMWGVWAPPIKLLDGFWLELDGRWLTRADAFTALPYGCSFAYENVSGLNVERFQFVPQEEAALFVRITLENREEQSWQGRLRLAVKTELMPVWLSDRLGVRDGQDRVRRKGDLVLGKDEENPWSFCLGVSEPYTFLPGGEEECPQGKTRGKGAYFTLELMPELAPGERKELWFTLSASSLSPEEAERTCRRVQGRREELLREKREVYEALAETAALRFPKRPEIEETYRWTQYLNDWIVRDVEQVGRGAVAGYAEFPWWFGHDTAYLAPALLMQGDGETVKSTLRLIKAASCRENGSGRVVHEISNNGVVFYEGMTTETPQFADAVWRTYCWTGDEDFLREMYPFCQKGAEYLDSLCVDGLPTGYGVTEIAGLDCICCDTAVHAVRDYQALMQMAGALGKQEEAERYRLRMEETFSAFERLMWLEEQGLYGDMAATKEEILPRAQTWQITLKGFPITDVDEIEGYESCKQDKSPEEEAEKLRLRERMQAVIREAETMEEGERRAIFLFGLGHSALPVEYGFVEQERAAAILEKTGSGFRPAEIAGEHIMPIGTGHRIVAEYAAGNPERVLEGMQLVAESFGRVTPGATSEIYPDSGCFVQAWNSFATMWPVAACIFGVAPDAARKRLSLKPCLCEEMDGVELKNLVIGGERFTLRAHVGEETWVELSAPEGWTVECTLPLKPMNR